MGAKYRDLTAHSQLAFTVWDVSCGKDEGLIGGATILLFNNKMQLKTGKQKLRLWPGKEADGSFPTTTPGKVPKHERGELWRLEKLVNKYERGQIHCVDWLDHLTFKAMEKIKEHENCKNGISSLYLVVDFCSLEHQVVFQESKEYGKWLLDSVYSRHMIGYDLLFSSFIKINGGKVIFEDNSKGKIIRADNI